MNKVWIPLLLALLITSISVTPAFAKDGDKVTFGNNVEVLPDEVVEGDLVVVGGNINVAGRVFGDAVAVGGNVDVSGEVVGQVVSIGGNVHLASTAQVQRGVVVTGGTLQREEGAQVRGEIVKVGPWSAGWRVWPWFSGWGAPRGNGDGFGLLLSIISHLLWAIALVAIALLAAAVFPTHLDVVRRTVESAPLQALGVGVLSLLVSLVLTPILIFTCIGLPLFWLAVVVAALFGTVAVALLAGERLLLAANRGNFTPVSAAVVGILVIWVASLLPFLGGILMLFVFFFGLGAVVLSRFGTISPPFSWQTKSPSQPGPPAAQRP